MTRERPTSTGEAANEGHSRRRFLRRAATAGALAVGGVGRAIGAAGDRGIAEFEELSVSSDNRIVDESGETFVMRGLNVADPKRLAETVPVRGKTPMQVLDLITDGEQGWYPRVVRIPASPIDIGEHPNGNAGPEYEEGELESPDAVRDDRRKMQPPQPPAFDEDQLRDYLDRYYDPVVEKCRERGVYCVVDFHRHWHEQPPGEEGLWGAENHLPYDSEYTNYWAYNDHELFGEDAPASWGHVDDVYMEETPGDGYVEGLESESDLAGTPYDSWAVNQALVDEATTFWDEVAARYADEPHVVFEPYNEPTEPGIWGPVEGCGAFHQKPLWDTFVDDFAGSIIDTIREHAPEKLVLMGVPGWSQSVQALHWRSFEDAGYEDVAVTYHIYADHDVSQMHNWLNDTDYRSPEDVAAETGEELVDPYSQPPDSVYTEECWGWESYEAQGLQNAMDHHPIAVTEVGWYDEPELDVWCRCSPSPTKTTYDYGKPFLEALESDDRISWVAWCADPRWLPAMFDVPWTIEEGELELTDDSWYETPDDQIPVKCEDPPCEWQLLGNPHMGEYVKGMLAEKRDEQVPFETSPLEPVDGTVPEDPDDDGRYEDFNANGEVDYSDVVTYFDNMDDAAMTNHTAAYDYNGNDDVDYADLVDLFGQV